MNKPLKAYEVRENLEGYCCIRFATNSATARREGANWLEVDWVDIESCTRMPWADQYAHGPVPKLALLSIGWRYECHHCWVEVGEDGCQENGDPFEPVEIDHAIYCCPECAARDQAEKRMRKSAESALIECALTKWPGIAIDRVHVYGVKLEPSPDESAVLCSVYFTFPGGKYCGHWVFGEGDQAWISKCDVEAWHKFMGKDVAA